MLPFVTSWRGRVGGGAWVGVGREVGVGCWHVYVSVVGVWMTLGFMGGLLVTFCRLSTFCRQSSRSTYFRSDSLILALSFANLGHYYSLILTTLSKPYFYLCFVDSIPIIKQWVVEIFDLENPDSISWISIFLYSYTYFTYIAFLFTLILLKHEVRLAPGKVDFMFKHFCFLNNSIVAVFEGLLCCSGHLLICWLHLIDICLRICFA